MAMKKISPAESDKKWIFSYNSRAKEYEEFSKHEDSENEVLGYLEKNYPFSNKIVLEFGCGSGKYTGELSKEADKYYALDKSEGLLDIAKEKHSRNNIKFIHSGAESIPLEDNSVDIVFGAWALSSMGDFKNQEKILSELKRVLKKEGKIILVENSWDNGFTKIVGLTEEKSKKIQNFLVNKSNFKIVKTLDTKIKFGNIEEEEEILKGCFINSDIDSFIKKQKDLTIPHKVIILEQGNSKGDSKEKLERLDVRMSNPLSLCWQITKKCNYSCPFCISGEQGNEKELSLDEVKKIIDILSDSGVIRVDFTGGEPLLKPDFPEILRYAYRKGLKTLVTSNGSVFNDELAKCLKETETLLLISVDGNEKTHDSFRGEGAFRRATENIRRYQDVGIPIRINFLIQKKNLDQIDYIFDLAKELEVGRLFYIFVAPQGRAYENSDVLLTESETKEYLEKIRKIKKNSTVPFITIQDYATNYHSCFLINPQGDVISQGYSEDECFNVGNILTDGLEKVWNDPAFNHKRHFLQYAYMFEYYM